MPVLEATNGLQVRSDHAYVIPPNSYLSIEQGRLVVTPRGDAKAPHLAVDHFFRSLAKEQGTRAIGVVLSGSGSDGTLGIAEIKALGGITFAQDERSARHASMPRSASESGCVDFVLPPDQIARRLAEIGGHPYLAAPDLEPEDDQEQFRRVLRSVRGVTGVDFEQYRDTTIKRRIARRMALHGITSLERYADLLAQDRDRDREPLPRRADQRHQLLPRPRAVPPPQGPRLPRDPALEGRQAAGAGVGAGLLHGSGGLLDRDVAARVLRRAATPARGADLRHRPVGPDRARQGAGGRLPGDDRGRAHAGAAAPLLPQGGPRLSDREVDPRPVHLRAAEHRDRSAVLAHGPHQLPQRAHLHVAGPAEAGAAGVPLRAADSRASSSSARRRRWDRTPTCSTWSIAPTASTLKKPGASRVPLHFAPPPSGGQHRAESRARRAPPRRPPTIKRRPTGWWSAATSRPGSWSIRTSRSCSSAARPAASCSLLPAIPRWACSRWRAKDCSSSYATGCSTPSGPISPSSGTASASSTAT